MVRKKRAFKIRKGGDPNVLLIKDRKTGVRRLRRVAGRKPRR